jgi:NAD(P)-dependent dehydrogenase (short-subunit alcohol dehydrogenase family)
MTPTSARQHMKGRIAVVTGASRGIGRAIATRFAAAGAQVVLAARSVDELQRTADAILAQGGDCRVQPTDVTDPEQVKALIDAAVAWYGGVDILVNNAGVAPRARLDELSVAEWDEVLAVNAHGVLYGCASVWKLMTARGGGIILNISSLVTQRPTRGFSLYAATKGFVESFSLALAEEGRSLGIRVHALAPGYVATALTRATSPEVPAEKCLLPADVAEVAASLAGSLGRYSSGSIVPMRR